MANKSGVNCPRRWLIGVNPHNIREFFIDNLMELLFTKEQKCRPDGLIVSMEGLLPAVFNAFSRLGIVPGQDLKIVSHMNVPSGTAHFENIEYVQFSAVKVLDIAMKILADWKRERLSEKAVDILVDPEPDPDERQPREAAPSVAKTLASRKMSGTVGTDCGKAAGLNFN